MAFLDLTANTELMKSENGLEFEGYTDQQLTDLKRNGSQAKLRSDMAIELNFSIDDIQLLDDVAVKYSLILNTALTYLQLYQYYYDKNSTQGLAFERMDGYLNIYNSYRNKFKSLKPSAGKNPASFYSRGVKIG